MFGKHRATHGLKKVFYFVIFGLVLVYVSPMIFAETLELGLEDAIAIGLENSLDIKSGHMGVNAADKDVKSAKAAYYPGINAGTSYSHKFNEDQQTPGTTTYNTDQVSLSLNLNQTIYTFGRLNTSVRAAENNKELAEIDLEEKKRSLAVDIRRAFYSYLLARETLAVKEESLAYREEALESAKARYEPGFTARRDVLQAESDLKSFIPELFAARNDIKYTLLKLRNILGIENGTDITIKGELKATQVNLEPKTLIATALSKNSSVRQYGTNISLQEILARQAEIEKYPSISGFAGVSLQKGFDIQNSNYTGSEWNSDINAGIKVQMDFSSLFPWSGNTADLEKKRIEIEKTNTELEALQDEIRLNIESILLDISELGAKMEAGEKAIELAQELFLSSKEMYENGLISGMEYDDAQIALKDSRVNYLSYIHSY
jgi:outer membrane protein